MPDVDIRRARNVDIEPALAVWRAAGTARRGGAPASVEREAQVRRALQEPGAFLLVADEAGRVVGMGLAVQTRSDDGAGPPVPGDCFVSLIYIAPDRWGEGLGGKVVDAVLAEARAQGYGRVQLWTQADNVRAQRLYESRDFRRSGREALDPHGAVIVQYARPL